MSDRIALVVVLAEDERSGKLVRRYLQHAVNARDIRILRAPAGKGDASAWIKRQYPREVREQRQRVHGRNKNAALLVHVDADLTSVARQVQELARALQAADHLPRGDGERIVYVVPKRHTETWLHGLGGGSVVDEDYDYKRDPQHKVATNQRTLRVSHDAKVGPAASSLYELTRPNSGPPPGYLPSVATAIPELRRLES